MTDRLRSRRPAATAALAVWASLLAAGCTAARDDVPTASSAPPDDPVAYADALVAGTNAVRAEEGLPGLAPSACAAEAAGRRAADLAGGRPLEHAPLDRVLDDCAPAMQAAENLSRAAADPAAVVEAWMGSPGHRANLLSEVVTELGVSCLPDDGGMLCSQVFLGP